MKLVLDGMGKADLKIGGFIEHMLDSFARHGMFDLDVEAEAFLDPDGHHLTEDLGIVLGDALRQSIGDGEGIRRFGHAVIPMDDALVQVTLDLSGRSYCRYEPGHTAQGPAGLLGEFFQAFTRKAGATLHISALAGHDVHHLGEAAFKAFGRALADAVSVDPRLQGKALSTKGDLS